MYFAAGELTPYTEKDPQIRHAKENFSKVGLLMLIPYILLDVSQVPIIMGTCIFDVHLMQW